MAIALGTTGYRDLLWVYAWMLDPVCTFFRETGVLTSGLVLNQRSEFWVLEGLWKKRIGGIGCASG